MRALANNTDKPKARIKYHWEPHEYETDELADIFDTPEGIRTLREFSSNGLYLELTWRDYDIPEDYWRMFVRMSASSCTAHVNTITILHVCYVSFSLAYNF